MSERLTFGTAGLRARLGEGPLRMNVRVVEQVARALAAWFPAKSSIIIGRDARHGSEDFANVTARVLAEAGHEPRIFLDPVPTPVVAHEVRQSDAAGGVVVTASHNPATDNGYKVYIADGGQLLPDDAGEIEALLAKEPWPDAVDATLPADVELLGEAEVLSYLATIARPAVAQPLSIVYSAMHGVGGDLFVRALQAAGHQVHKVPEQHHPDPDFPTAAFPNPEEPGTLDLAMALADDVQANLVMANDPDADRLAVAVLRHTGWERLTGDQIGLLLGSYILTNHSDEDHDRSVATTIVSSTMLSKLAAASGVTCHTTLTGFKWLARAADASPASLVFAYEEALGYAVTPLIRDKDGISAGLLFAEMASVARAAGKSIDDLLADLYDAHGFHFTSQVSAWFDGDDPMTEMTQRMEGFRESPPAEIARCAVREVVDLLGGTVDFAPSDVLIYKLDGGRVIVRPSGTEPKLKVYLEAVANDAESAAARLGDLERAARTLLE